MALGDDPWEKVSLKGTFPGMILFEIVCCSMPITILVKKIFHLESDINKDKDYLNDLQVDDVFV